eukprot:gb/GFBE01016262.1/.p1 GENE.gb/GFBE01016262.1/~~gb/GFBE01016262.1/.p1  ORF type:complete len:416 (+),score=49.39 gb/GFBE01016262.1/:1-1248(+)
MKPTTTTTSVASVVPISTAERGAESRSLLTASAANSDASSLLEVQASQRCRCFWTRLHRLAQQKDPLPSLPSWQYRANPQAVCAGLMFVFFLAMLIALRLTADAIHAEVVVPYKAADGQSKQFTLDKDLRGDVWVYYHLPDVNMNRKEFVESKDTRAVTTFLGFNTCDNADDRNWAELRRGSDVNFSARINSVSGTNVTPCGLVALSFFTDRYRFSRQLTDGTWDDIAIDSSNVALPADATNYARKVSIDSTGQFEMSGDKSWLTEADYEHWKVWYRTPASPGVRNLYAVIKGGLPKGSYKVDFLENSGIWETWGLTEKRIIFAEKHDLGSRGAVESLFVICVIIMAMEFAACIGFGSGAIAKCCSKTADGTARMARSNGDSVVINVKPRTLGAAAKADDEECVLGASNSVSTIG